MKFKCAHTTVIIYAGESYLTAVCLDAKVGTANET